MRAGQMSAPRLPGHRWPSTLHRSEASGALATLTGRVLRLRFCLVISVRRLTEACEGHWRLVPVLSPFYVAGNRGSERLRNLPRDPQQEGGGVGTWTQACLPNSGASPRRETVPPATGALPPHVPGGSTFAWSANPAQCGSLRPLRSQLRAFRHVPLPASCLALMHFPERQGEPQTPAQMPR